MQFFLFTHGTPLSNLVSWVFFIFVFQAAKEWGLLGTTPKPGKPSNSARRKERPRSVMIGCLSRSLWTAQDMSRSRQDSEFKKQNFMTLIHPTTVKNVMDFKMTISFWKSSIFFFCRSITIKKKVAVTFFAMDHFNFFSKMFKKTNIFMIFH